MRRLSLLMLLVLLCAAVAPAFADSAMPQPGQMAPAFRLQDQNGHRHSPADYRGHWLVMYFYPKDFTPGCTTEVCTFRDDITKLRMAGAHVIGISLDDVKSHARFAAKYHVPFPLLADSSHKVAAEYGVLTSMGDAHYARRTTFLVSPDGRIAKVYVDVDPKKNSSEVLAE
jgi:Peroxiredoxin